MERQKSWVSIPLFHLVSRSPWAHHLCALQSRNETHGANAHWVLTLCQALSLTISSFDPPNNFLLGKWDMPEAWGHQEEEKEELISEGQKMWVSKEARWKHPQRNASIDSKLINIPGILLAWQAPANAKCIPNAYVKHVLNVKEFTEFTVYVENSTRRHLITL